MVLDPSKHSKIKSTTTTPIMKMYAMQSVKEQAGKAVHKYMLPQVGGAPVGFHWQVEGSESASFHGTKHFFFKSQCFQKNEKAWPTIKSDEHVWVTREEISEYLTEDDEYLQHVVPML